MRGPLPMMIVIAIIMSACSSGGTADTPAFTTTTPADPTTTTGAALEAAERWDADLATMLIELELANDGTWTVENAVAAMELLLPVIRNGVDEYPPIDVTRLNFFLDDHADELTEEQRDRLTARVPTLRPIGLAQDDAEAERAAFQLAAVTAANDFASRTGYTLDGEIVVASSQYGLFPGGLLGGARSFDDAIDWNRWSGFFATDAEYVRARELVEAAAADGDNVCLIITGERYRNLAPVPRSAAIYHEVVHCHQHAIHPGGMRGFFGDPSAWMDEGYASWAGEAFVGGTGISKIYWDLYHDGVGPIGGHKTTEGAYDGIALFSYLHDNGVDGWSNFVSWFRDVRGGINAETAKFTAVWTPLSEEAQTVWAATSLQRPAYGDIWTYTTGPGIGNSTFTRTPRPTPVAVDSERRFVLGPGEQGTYAFEPRLADADALLLQVSLPDGGVIRWPWGEDQVSTGALDVAWCLGDECVCEDGRELGPPAPEFTESPFVTIALTGGVVSVDLVEPEDECEEEEEPVLAATGPCPGGVWQADPEATANLLATLYREVGIADPTYEGGPVTMSFFDDGSFRFDYVETTFSETIEGIDAQFILNGGSAGSWESDAATLTVQIDSQDITLQLILDGTPGLSSAPTGGTGGGSAPYVCDGNDELLIDPTFEQRFWPYPREWTRVTP